MASHIDRAKGDWVEELPNVLWAYRTTARTATHETPFCLVYGSEAVIPTEIGMPTTRLALFDPATNDQGLRFNLDLLSERREIASLRESKYKATFSIFSSC